MSVIAASTQLCMPENTYHELLTFLETPQERCQSTNIHRVGKDGHEVVQNACHLTEQCADVLGSLGDLNVQQLLNSQGEALLVGHHGDVIQSVEVWQGLHVGLVFDQLLGTTVKQTDVGIGADDLFTIELQNQTQHTVSGRVLRTKVDGVMADLAAGSSVLGFEGGAHISLRRALLVGQRCEGRVGRDEAGGLVAGGFCIPARQRRRNRPGSGDSSVSGEARGAEAEPFGRAARQASEGSSHSGERGVRMRVKRGGEPSIQTQLGWKEGELAGIGSDAD